MNPTASPHSDVSGPERSAADGAAFRLHLAVGWWMLFAFLTIGLVLETLHAFKSAFYLSPANETRRLLWTLAHSHGTLFGLINIAFAFSVRAAWGWSPVARTVASRSLLGASVLMPAGFFLGGIVIYRGDPGLGVLLVPVGGMLLALGVLLTALGVRQRGRSMPLPPQDRPAPASSPAPLRRKAARSGA